MTLPLNTEAPTLLTMIDTTQNSGTN